jgi:MFS family permease
MNLKFPKLNQIILLIIVSEFIIATADALIAPIYALFVTQDVGAAAQAVGFSVAIYWVTKSILQLPIARYLDKNHGEIDDYYSMVGGLLIVVVGNFLFYFATTVSHVYLIQFLLAVGNSFVVPPFYAIFTRHIDKNNEGFEWSLRSSFSLGAGTALGGALSGVLGAIIGFRSLFLINGLLMLMGWVGLIFMRPWIIPRGHPPTDRILVERPRT